MHDFGIIECLVDMQYVTKGFSALFCLIFRFTLSDGMDFKIVYQQQRRPGGLRLRLNVHCNTYSVSATHHELQKKHFFYKKRG